MTIVLGILGALLGLMALFLLVPARVRVRYVDILEVWAGVGPITLRLLPPKARKSKPVKAKAGVKKPQKAAPKPAKSLPGIKPHLSLDALLAYARLAGDALGRMMKTVRIRQLRLHAVVADADPGKAALAYGGAAAAINTVLPAFEGIINWRRSEIAVDVDFQGNPTVTIDVTVSILPIVALIAGLRAFLLYLNINKALDQKQAAKAAPAPGAGETSSAMPNRKDGDK